MIESFPGPIGGGLESVRFQVAPELAKNWDFLVSSEKLVSLFDGQVVPDLAINQLRIVFTDEELNPEKTQSHVNFGQRLVFGEFEFYEPVTPTGRSYPCSVKLDVCAITQATKAGIDLLDHSYDPDISFDHNASVILVHELEHYREFIKRLCHRPPSFLKSLGKNALKFALPEVFRINQEAQEWLDKHHEEDRVRCNTMRQFERDESLGSFVQCVEVN